MMVRLTPDEYEGLLKLEHPTPHAIALGLALAGVAFTADQWHAAMETARAFDGPFLREHANGA